MVYGASTATTILPCLTTFLALPTATPAVLAAGIPSLSEIQRVFLLASYGPFFVICFMMTVDMSLRLASLVRAGLAVQEAAKTR